MVPLAIYPPGFNLSNSLIYDPAVSHWVRGSNWVRGASGTGIASSHKLHAVPLRALQPDSTGTALILNADKDKFARSEGFDKNNWPGVTTAVWGAEPFWKEPRKTSQSQEGRYSGQLNTKEPQHREDKDTAP